MHLVDTKKNKVIPNDEYAKLQQDETNWKNMERYLWRQQGSQLWRWDPVTERECAVLGPKPEWSRTGAMEVPCGIPDEGTSMPIPPGAKLAEPVKP